jgi:hypothetical protein
VSSTEVQSELLSRGSEAHPGNAKFLNDLTIRELDRWREAIRIAGIEPQ